MSNCLTLTIEKKDLKLLDKQVRKKGITRSAYISMLLMKQVNRHNKHNKKLKGE